MNHEARRRAIIERRRTEKATRMKSKGEKGKGRYAVKMRTQGLTYGQGADAPTPIQAEQQQTNVFGGRSRFDESVAELDRSRRRAEDMRSLGYNPYL